MTATATDIPALEVRSVDEMKSPRTLAINAAARIPLPPSPGRPPSAPAQAAGATRPSPPKKAKPSKKQARTEVAAARPARAPTQARPKQPARAAPTAAARLTIGAGAAAAWAAAMPVLLTLAAHAGALIFWLCFQILPGASRAANAVRGRPAWNARLLAAHRAATPAPDAATAAAREAEVARLLRLHGDGSLSAATTINPEFEWFIAKFDAPHTGIDGALAWCDAAGYGRRVAMAVADPLAALADWPALAAAFVAAHPGRAQFWHASADFAAVLDKMGGFFVNDFGAETVIDLRVRGVLCLCFGVGRGAGWWWWGRGTRESPRAARIQPRVFPPFCARARASLSLSLSHSLPAHQNRSLPLAAGPRS
jgi:hypothetical protein